jgi:hypothetical protein
VGLVGLVANYQAVGEDFHITSGEALPWDEIYRTIAAAAGTECRLCHLPTELISVVASEWMWTPLFAGDLGHSAIFDNSKIKRFVPAFHPVVTWPQGVRSLAAWRAGHPRQHPARSGYRRRQGPAGAGTARRSRRDRIWILRLTDASDRGLSGVPAALQPNTRRWISRR